MKFASIDSVLNAWAQKCSLKLSSTEWAGREVRNYYVSSQGNECFQICFDEPSSEEVVVHCRCIEGTEDKDGLEKTWRLSTQHLSEDLDKMWGEIIDWMKPHQRYFSK